MTIAARRSAITLIAALLVLMLAACGASAQWDAGRTFGVAASWAYSGGDNGYRLELGGSDFVIDAGFFNADNYAGRGDGDVIGLEVGVGPSMFMPGYEGTPFVIGVAGYRFSPDDPALDDDDSFTWWAGAGDFEHARGGLFYQYRYIFGGPIKGSQGIVGWAF